MLKPRQVVPPLQVTTLDGQPSQLAEQNPESFSMVVFYRGLHRPQCHATSKVLPTSSATS